MSHARFFKPPAVLVIDDEEGIRYALTRLLEERGFKVHAAPDGATALELLRAHPGEISICICDFKMPGMDGIETLTKAHEIDAEMIRILLTGYATLQAAIDATNRGLDAFITKPYQVRELRAKLDELLAARRASIAAQRLGGIGLFAKLPQPLLAEIYPALTRTHVLRGAVIQERGAITEQLTLVREGEVRLEAVGPDGRARPLMWLGPGEHFGDAELVAGEPSPLRAVASLDCELETLSRADFVRLAQQHPAIGEAVAQAMTRRLHRMVSSDGVPGLTIATDRGAPALARALQTEGADVALLRLGAAAGDLAMGPHRAVGRFVDAGLPCYAAPRGALAELDVAAVLGALRKQHRVVVVELSGEGAANAKAAAQADRAVRFVAAPGRLEAVVSGEPESRGYRVLLEEGELVDGGRGLRLLARRLLGTTVALALSAGGARGVAHIGVLMAFEKAGLEIDAYAGCSVGACIAGYLAAGQGIDAAVRDFKSLELAARSLPFGEPRWEKPRKLVYNAAGDLRIEEMQVPYYCNATDLIAGEERVFDSGPVAPAICASMCTPGIFPPYHFDGRVYTDGALVNGLPANVLQERGFDVVAAVDVLHVASGWHAPPERAAGLARLLTATLPDLAQKLGALQVVLRSVLLAARHLIVARAVACDLMIRPQFRDEMSDDFLPATYPEKIEAGLRAGEIAARDLLARRAALAERYRARS